LKTTHIKSNNSNKTMNSITSEDRRADSIDVLRNTIEKSADYPENLLESHQSSIHALFTDIPTVSYPYIIRTYTKAPTTIPPNGFELRGKTFVNIANLIKAEYIHKGYRVKVPENAAKICLSKNKSKIVVWVCSTEEIDDDGYNVFIIIVNMYQKNKKITNYDILFEINELLLDDESPPPLRKATQEEISIAHSISPDQVLLTRHETRDDTRHETRHETRDDIRNETRDDIWNDIRNDARNNYIEAAILELLSHTFKNK
jgi:hypothetical protein